MDFVYLAALAVLWLTVYGLSRGCDVLLNMGGRA
jgi:hypothetical protein